MLKRIIALTVALSTAFLLFSCKESKGVFTHCEMKIELGEDFYTTEYEKFDAVYTNGRYLVAVRRLSFVAAVSDNISETMTPHEFGEYWVNRFGIFAVVKTDEITYCEYYDSNGADEYYYLSAFYRTAYAYFVILFVAPIAIEYPASDDFRSYAQRVTFEI